MTLMNYVYFLPMTSYLGCKGSDLGFFCAVAVYWLVLLAVQLRMPTILVPKLPHRHTSLVIFSRECGGGVPVRYGDLRGSIPDSG